jgi:hypothetical protein
VPFAQSAWTAACTGSVPVLSTVSATVRRAWRRRLARSLDGGYAFE